MNFLKRKVRQIKNAEQHRGDTDSGMVPLTTIEYENLMNQIIDLEEEKRVLCIKSKVAKELLEIQNRSAVFTPKIERSVKYSLTRLAMRITMAKSPDEVVKLIDHATERAGMFLKTFSQKGDLGKFEKHLFIDEEVDGIITVRCEQEEA